MTLATLFPAIKAGLVRFRAAATGIVVTLGAVIVWTVTQAGAASTSYQKYIEAEEKSKGFIDRYGNEFAKADDTKADLLNNIVFRVRTGVHSSELGTDLLCWAAARAKARRPGDKTTALTSAQILAFMDANPREFRMKLRDWSWVPPFRHEMHVPAAVYCKSYLATQPEPIASSTTPDAGGLSAGPNKIAKPVATDPAFGNAQLYVHFALEPQRPAAMRLNADLSSDARFSGLRAQGVELIKTYSAGNEVRYYKLADKAKAMRLAETLRCAGEAPPALIVKGYESSPGVAQGVLELWIGPGAGAGGCSLAPG